MFARIQKGERCIISAWVSGVARFDKMGDARASECGTSDVVQTLTLFLYISVWLKHNALTCRRGASNG